MSLYRKVIDMIQIASRYDTINPSKTRQEPVTGGSSLAYCSICAWNIRRKCMGIGVCRLVRDAPRWCIARYWYQSAGL